MHPNIHDNFRSVFYVPMWFFYLITSSDQSIREKNRPFVCFFLKVSEINRRFLKKGIKTNQPTSNHEC